MLSSFYVSPKNISHYLVAGIDEGIILITKDKNEAYQKQGKIPDSEVFLVTPQAYTSITDFEIGYITDPRIITDCINNVIFAYGCAAPLYQEEMFIGVGNADNMQDRRIVAYIDRVGYISLGGLWNDHIFRRFRLTDDEKVDSRGEFDFSCFAKTVGDIRSQEFRDIARCIPFKQSHWDAYRCYVFAGRNPNDFAGKYIGTYSCVNDFLSDNEDRYGIKSVYDMNESVEIFPVGNYFWKGEPKKLLKSFPEYGW